MTDVDSDNGHAHYDDLGAGREWGTPAWVWKPLARALDGFDLDPASGAEEEPIADIRWTKEADGLPREWFGDVWLNPPYSRKHNPVWAEKALKEARRDEVRTLTALVPASTDTHWFQDHYAKADILTFIRDRLSFDGEGDNSATFANVIATWGDVPEEYVAQLQDFGFVVRTVGET